VNHQQDAIRQAFPPRYQLPSPSPRAIIKQAPEVEQFEGNHWIDHDVAKGAQTGAVDAYSGLPTPPPEDKPWDKTLEVPASPIRTTEFLPTPPPSPVERLYDNTIGKIFPRRSRAEYVDREFIRVYECGRVHTSPEDHAMLCAPIGAVRRKYVYDRDQKSARWTHDRRSRSRSRIPGRI
jgi:hypothetical protein